MACQDSGAHLDHRVHLVLQVYLVSQVCLAPMETKEQRDQEDLLGYPASTGSPDSRGIREKEERKEQWVCQGEMVGHPDLQGLPDLQDRPPTRQAMEGMVFQVDQDSLGLWDQKEIKETQVHLDMHLKDRKESRVSSLGLMGDLCTLVAWQESRVRADPLVLRDLQAHMVIQARKERLVFQVDPVDRG